MMIQPSSRRSIEVRGLKWPERPKDAAMTTLLGEDSFGTWLGVAKGNPWWAADHSRSGVFHYSFVKLVPRGAFWSVCFQPVEPVVDVDIVLPVRWIGDVLEEVDLEVDILRSADGTVSIRDQDELERVRAAWEMPDALVAQVAATTEEIRARVEQGAEPFGEVGKAWLARWLAEVDS